ncbi:MAG: flagellar basal body-associated FliL family protein [Deltaproteobacteria bacterium]|jgi:flagellar FliL protein|nr:flagellar basal body-associated FliL family protein [Deltaproteobacteria bacterium]
MSQDDEVPKKKKGKLKWVLLVFILLLGGGGGAAYYFGFLDKFLNRGEGTEDSQGKTQQTGAAGVVSPTATLPTLLVNLYDPLGRRYIQLDLELELVSPEVGKEIQAQNARIRDSLILLLSSKTFPELSSQEGKHILRNEILDRLNQVLGGPKVVRVFFTNMVIQ